MDLQISFRKFVAGIHMEYVNERARFEGQEANPYDSNEPAYATWLFRSGQQDIKPDSDGKTMMLDHTADGDWYTYKALDMGWEFTRRIKLTSKEGKIIIEDIDVN